MTTTTAVSVASIIGQAGDIVTERSEEHTTELQSQR